MHELLDALGGGGLRAPLRPDRVVQNCRRARRSPWAWSPRRTGLALLGQHRRRSLDRQDEAQVEHLVGLVEHEDLDVAQVSARCSIRSSRRPGVATSTSTPRQRLDLRPTARRRRHGDGEAQVLAIGACSRRSGWRVRGWARAPACGSRARGAGWGSAAGGAATAGRRRRSCRCRSGRCPAGRGPASARGSPAPGSGSGWCSPWRRARRGSGRARPRSEN